jgi:hypothetical protein
MLLEDFGIAVIPQTNNYETTKKSLEEVARQLKTQRSIDEDLLDHFHRSRPLKWLERNALMVVTIRQFQDGYYENQVFIRTRLLFCRVLMYMLYAIQQREEAKGQSVLFSTKMMNNWETLDIHHHLVLQVPGGKKRFFDVKCIPAHHAPSIVLELSELAAEIAPEKWLRKKKRLTTIYEGLRKFEKMYLGCFPPKGETPFARVVEKLYNCLFYFTRSFRPSEVQFDANVYLAIAFEGLLTDGYTRGADTVIKRRVALALKGVRGVRKMSANAQVIMWKRNAIMHHGSDDRQVEPDVELGRETFVLVFLKLVDLIGTIRLDPSRPIGGAVGDNRRDEEA